MADDKDDMTGIARGLAAIDTVIREASAGKGEPGPAGSGLYYLLDQLAVSTLGVKRSTFPVEKDKPAADDEIETGQGVEPSGGPVPADPPANA
jgi:hypothetical protein